MSEVVAHPGKRPQYGREIAVLLVGLFVCAEVAASLTALLGLSAWIVLALSALVALATIALALVRGGVSSLFGSRGRSDEDPLPPPAQSVSVALALSMGIVFYTYVASVVGMFTGWSDIDDVDPSSPASALFSPWGQLWLFFNPISLVCGIAIVMLFARMLSLSRTGLLPASVSATV